MRVYSIVFFVSPDVSFKINRNRDTSMRRSQIKKRPLADTVLATLEPESKEYRVLDGNNLYFRVKPKGSKSWQLRHKQSNGKWTWLGLGSYPLVSGQLARKKAAEMLEDISKGIAPTATKPKQQLTTTDTFEALFKEWFNEKVTGAKRWVDANAKRNKAAMYLHILPTMGNRPFTEITAYEWFLLFKVIQSKTNRKGTPIIEQSKRLRQICHEIYTFAQVTGRAKYNPLEGIQKFLDSAKAENMAHVSAKELPALIRAIRHYPTRDVAIGLQLLAMLFPRPTELRGATWNEFDLKAALWTIPAERTKRRREHIIPLPKQAIALLNELKPYSGGSPYLFPSRHSRAKSPILSDMTFTQALRRLGYHGQQTPHGFRHIASTLLNSNGFNENHVEMALSHAKEGVAGVYNKAAYLPERVAMMQWYADHLDNLAGAVHD